MSLGINFGSSQSAHGRIRLLALALMAAVAPSLSPVARAQCPVVFYPAGNFTVGAGPSRVVAGDFNGDGKPDLALTSTTNINNVSILLGTGSGAFTLATNFAVGTYPSLAVGDFNNDGRLDLAVTNVDTRRVSILLGTGSGSFGVAPYVSLVSSPRAIATGDFNGDGYLDLATANWVGGTPGGSYSVMLGVGNGAFGAATDIALGEGPGCLAVADFNADGRPDIAVGDENNEIFILLGTGSGSFGAATTYFVGSDPVSILEGDFNSDGNLDLVTVNISSNNASMLLGTGTGAFGAATNFALGNFPHAGDVSDFNGDGHLDLVATGFYANNISVLLGTGNGLFSAATNYLVGASPTGVVAGDFSGDGKLDFAVANNANNNVSILLAFPSSTPPAITTHPATQSVLVGDSVAFSVTATSPPDGTSPTYQWRRNGVDLANGGAISGATTSTLSIAPAGLSDNGSAFVCIVTNGCGSTTSTPAGLAVLNDCSVDFNHDGFIDFFDYLDFVDAYSIGC